MLVYIKLDHWLHQEPVCGINLYPLRPFEE